MRIGDYARHHGVSVDTVRRWEREGRITGQRSPGGQRLYALDAAPAVGPEAAPNDSGAEATSLRPLSRRAPTVGSTAHGDAIIVPEWDRAVKMARAGYEVDKIEAERAEFQRRQAEESEARDRAPFLAAKRAQQERDAARSRAAREAEDAQRLSWWRTLARIRIAEFPAGSPAAV
ncbi:MAG: MerR family transcriptional regulator, partial [Terracidiphilus sp.]